MPRRSTTDRVEALFRLYEQKMYRIAYAILHDEGQAEDAVIAAFEKILRRDGVPRRPESDSAERLVVSAVRSTAIDQYRANARERQHSMLTDDVTMCMPPTDQTANSPIDAHIEQESVHEMVDGLPEPYGSVIKERFLHDQTVRQTAQTLGISESNVRKRQERGLNMLRDRKGRLDYEIPSL